MIKTIIFDFDQTLYNSNKELYGWKDYIKNALDYSLSKVNCANKKAFIDKYKLRDGMSYFRIAGAFIQEFGSCKPVLEYIEKYIYRKDDLNDLEFIENDYLVNLTKSFNLYVVSGSSVSHVKSYMKRGGIDCSLFKGIYCCVHEKIMPSKLPCYKEILKKEKIKPDEVLVLGDSIHSDLFPAMSLGMHVQQCLKLEDIPYSINQALIYTNKDYKKEQDN